MWRRPVWLALIAAVGAILAWLLSQPFLPYTTVNPNLPIEAHYTLGTFYGWFERSETRIGSAEGADVRLDADSAVAPWHARFEHRNEEYWLVPQGGWVALNDVSSNVSKLAHGDRIGIGQNSLLFLQRSLSRERHNQLRGGPRPRYRPAVAPSFLSKVDPVSSRRHIEIGDPWWSSNPVGVRTVCNRSRPVFDHRHCQRSTSVSAARGDLRRR